MHTWEYNVRSLLKVVILLGTSERFSGDHKMINDTDTQLNYIYINSPPTV